MGKHFPTEKTFHAFHITGGVMLPFVVILDVIKLSIISVPNAFPEVVFAAICTIVSLGIATVSIVIGALDRKVLGFAIRDILPRVNVLNMKLSITVLFSTIIIGFIAFSFDYCTTLGALLLYDCMYMIALSRTVWQIAADEKYVQTMILKDVDKKQDHIETTERWLSELRDAVCERNDQKQEKYIELIRAYLGKLPSDTSLEFFPGHIKRVFQMAIPEIGFARAYNRVLCLNNPHDSKLSTLFDRESIAIESVDELQFLPAERIADYKITQIVYDIVKGLVSDDKTKSTIVYRIFSAICKNRTISDDVRMDLLKSIIKQVTAYYWNAVDNNTYYLIYVYVFKSFVLENDNQIEREILFSFILRRLYSMLQPIRHHENAIPYLAQSFRMIYFYSAYEKELLTQEYRDQLATLLSFKPTGKDKIQSSISDLAQRYAQELIIWYVNEMVDAENQHDFYYEYFPESMTMNFKNVVWSERNRLLFVFLFYLSSHRFQVFPLCEALRKSRLSTNDKRILVESYIGLYDEKQGEIELASEISIAYSAFAKKTGLSLPIHKPLLKNNYEEANALLFDLHKQLGTDITLESVYTDQVDKKIEAFFEPLDGIQIDKGLSFEDSKRFTLHPSLVPKATVSDENLANTAAYFFIEYLNHVINQVLPSWKITFTAEGVKKMLMLINQDNFSYTNCQFCDNLALTDSVRQSEDYNKLRDVLQGIQGKIDGQIYQTLFLRGELAFNYRFNMINAGEKPTKEIYNPFLEKNKVAEGKYRIDGVLCDYNQAVELIESVYCVEEYEFEITTNISDQLGVRIDYH